MAMPSVFVGSSSEQLPLVKKLLIELESTAVVNPWTRSFTPGETTLDALMANANEADFALFIFGPDDWTESRSVGAASPRDNVVFEAGLFGGILGWARSIIVHARGVKLPSDLLGLTLIPYNGEGDAGREAQIVAAKVAEVIEKLGWRGSESLPGQLQGHWWQFTLSDATRVEKSVLALFDIRRTGSRLSMTGRAWTAEGALVSEFRSMATAVNEETRTFFYYWEGEWPGHADAPQFFGKGEIVLEDAKHASGYFTVRSDGAVDPRERKRVTFLRADAADVEIMKSDDHARRSELILHQLERRKGLKFTGA
jgi:hypothetical protein